MYFLFDSIFILIPILLAESSIFTNREFAFTLQGDILVRYLSFENQADMEKEICTRLPFKIDIGPVMTAR